MINHYPVTEGLCGKQNGRLLQNDAYLDQNMPCYMNNLYQIRLVGEAGANVNEAGRLSIFSAQHRPSFASYCPDSIWIY